MHLSLPQDDPNREARAAQLAEQTTAYSYNREHMGALFADKVPKGEDYDLHYTMAVIETTAALLRNRAGQKTGTWPPSGVELSRFAALPPVKAIDELFRTLEATAGHQPGARPSDLSGYADLISTAPKPLALSLSPASFDDDLFFAWQHVAGATPITIRGLKELPDNLAIDAATYARALGGKDRLEAALAEGRLFLSDYSVFDGMAAGQTDGMQKYIWAPMALFARLGDGQLHPVGIQTGQRPGEDSPLWTPQDGVAWRMAKTCVTTADMNMNGVIAHFGLCHLVAEAFICVTHRRLSESHPIFHLLAPHFHYTLAVNETARTQLVNPGGKQDRFQSGTYEANFDVMNKAMAAVRYDSVGARAEFSARNVADASLLPDYPFRDDGIPIADALQRWADSYVRVYYANDDAVRGDYELAAWAEELAGPGGFGGMPKLDGVAALARFVGDMLWRLTGFHAVINYGGWDFAAWAPNMPSAAFGPAPRKGAQPTENDWLEMLPPLSVANGLLELLHTLLSIRLNHVGQYPRGHFTDPRVKPALSALEDELGAIEKATQERNASRIWSFPYLYPSRVSNSIHVL